MMIESNYSYLSDASVAQMANGDPLRTGCPITMKGAFAPEGGWLVAVRDFHLPGGAGNDWVSGGVDVKAGQRFRLLRRGTPASASIWEIA